MHQSTTVETFYFRKYIKLSFLLLLFINDTQEQQRLKSIPFVASFTCRIRPQKMKELLHRSIKTNKSVANVN